MRVKLLAATTLLLVCTVPPLSPRVAGDLKSGRGDFDETGYALPSYHREEMSTDAQRRGLRFEPASHLEHGGSAVRIG